MGPGIGPYVAAKSCRGKKNEKKKQKRIPAVLYEGECPIFIPEH